MINNKKKLWNLISYIFIYIVLQFVLVGAYSAWYVIEYGVTPTTEDIFQPAIYISLVTSLILFIVMFLINRRKIVHDAKNLPRFFLGIVFGGFFIILGINIALNIIYQQLGIDGTSLNQEYVIQMFNTNPLAMAIPTVLFIPLIEEIVFRGVILEFFEQKFNVYVGIIVSSLLFAYVHTMDVESLIYMPVYFCLGSVFGIMYVKYKKNILVPVGIHLINNLFSFISIMLLQLLENFI